jgi:Zn-dependent peptidase ImmA (M78 family)/transcriptional regulator with XRE-family HTH domain
MTIGVNGFIGERLIEAREARGIMTQSSLAEQLEMSNNTINSYERNKSKPRPETIADIAKHLNVKEFFFFMPLTQKVSNTVFWRSRHISTKERRIVAERKFGWSKWLIDEYLKSFMDMPQLELPKRKDTGVPDNPNNLTDYEVEQISYNVRQFWGLGQLPIDNMVALLENNGVMLTYGLVNSDKLDAFSNVSEYDNSYHIFLSTDKKSAVRSRYDAAHELGHLILHSHLPKGYLNDKNHSLIEHQANRFASAFLLPLESFRKDVWMTSIEAFKVLKQHWKVSVGAIIKRCEDIGLFGDDESKARRMWIKYKREWKTIEEDKFEIEQPQLMKRCIDALLEAKVKTKSQILFDIPFSQMDIESLLNLPENYLSEDFGELKQFPTPTLKVNNLDSSSTFGQLLSFEGRRRN